MIGRIEASLRRLRSAFSRSEWLARLLLLMMTLAGGACAAPVTGLWPPGQNEPTKSIYLVSHGWHAGIVVKRADIPAGVFPQHHDFPDAEYLEVGWGDRDYYQRQDPHLGIVLKAVLLPTASVLHIVGFSGSVPSNFLQSEIIRIDLSDRGFERLCTYIEKSYAKDASGKNRPLGTGLYGNSRFYLSRDIYHAFNTCNVWTARALRAAGCPIIAALAIEVDDLMSKAAAFGEVIQPRPGSLLKRPCAPDAWSGSMGRCPRGRHFRQGREPGSEHG